MHVPVLLQEVVDYLNLEGKARFIDCTLNGGGHTSDLYQRYPELHILGIELDPFIVETFRQEHADLLDRVAVINDSFANLKQIVEQNQFYPDSILFDLGVSSWHYEAGRGFSFRDSSSGEPLDMRFNPHTQVETAADIVNTYSEADLAQLLEMKGEEQFAIRIAQTIVEARKTHVITTVGELVALIRQSVPPWYTHRKIHYATKTFQALRVTVNKELEVIEQGVRSAIEVLRPDGRLLVISFQGHEDKLVRELFKEHVKAGTIEWVTRTTIKPTWDEIQKNPRARSAKMKIIQKR